MLASRHVGSDDRARTGRRLKQCARDTLATKRGHDGDVRFAPYVPHVAHMAGAAQAGALLPFGQRLACDRIRIVRIDGAVERKIEPDPPLA